MTVAAGLLLAGPARAEIVIQGDDWDRWIDAGPAAAGNIPQVVETADVRKSLVSLKPNENKFITYPIRVDGLPPGRTRFPVTLVIRAVGDDTTGLTIRNLSIDPDDPASNTGMQVQTSFISILVNGINITAAGQISRARDDRNLTADADMPGTIGAAGPQVPDPTYSTIDFPDGIIATRNATLELRPGINILRFDPTDPRDLPVYDPDSGWQAFSVTIGAGEAGLTGGVAGDLACFPDVVRAITPNPYRPGDTVTVSLTAGRVFASTRITDRIPSGWTVASNGGGAVDGSSISFTTGVDGNFGYTLTAPRDIQVRFAGSISVTAAECSGLPVQASIRGDSVLFRDPASLPGDEPITGGTALDFPSAVAYPAGGQEEVSASPLTINVFASGTDIWGIADEGRMVSLGDLGTFDIRCVAPRIGGSNPWCKAGVMARTSIQDGSSAYAFLHITGANGTDFQFRDAAGANAANRGQTGPGGIVHELRLMRRAGTLVEAFARNPGEPRWRAFGSRDMPDLGAVVQVGVAVTSHDVFEVAGGRFEDIQLSATPPPVSPPVVNLACAVERPNVRLTFTPPAGATAIEVLREGTLIAVLTGSATGHTDTPPSLSTSYSVLAYDASNLSSAPAVCATTGLRSTGGVSEMLIAGPIDLGFSGAACDDTGRLGLADYLNDGFGTGEDNILVKEGDDISPDFGGAAGGMGVKPAPNVNLNPNAAAGALTIWRASTDGEGRINYNAAANLGDPLDDYIIFSIVYLENTTPTCLDCILEVGSDDAFKLRVNGALRVPSAGGCRGIPAYGLGNMVPVTLATGKNIVLIGVVERGGGTDVRLVVRNPDRTPLTDGRVKSSLVPPAEYPTAPTAVVDRSLSLKYFGPGDQVRVTLSASNVVEPISIVETFPTGWSVIDAGGGTVSGNRIIFSRTDAGDSVYEIKAPDTADRPVAFSGILTGAGAGACAPVGGTTGLPFFDCDADPASPAVTLEAAFAFRSQPLDCPTLNDPQRKYTVVLHQNGTNPAPLEYSLARGWGYEVVYQGPRDPGLPPSPYTVPGGFGQFGPFDESPNTRTKYPNTCHEELYDSFIGAKNFGPLNLGAPCNAAAVGNTTDPCTADTIMPGGLNYVPEGIIFRVDVPPGRYRFVGAFGDSDNPHAQRILAEDGGFGPPSDIGPNHVVLVNSFDQNQETIGDSDATRRGEGVFARVGFECRIPPLGDGVPPSPQFVNMDEDGKATGGPPSSPTLEVTEGYIRIHQLQGNSNDAPGSARDPNGGDAVILEIWRIEDAAPAPPVLAAATGGFRQVSLSWTPAPGPAPASYTIHRATTPGGPYTQVAERPGTETAHVDAGLADDSQFCYVVRARTTVESASSNERCARTEQARKLFRRGDLNTDQSINLTDAINLLGALFLGQPELATCKDAADVDDSGNLSITDPIYLLSYSFQGGDEPPAPGPKICGADPSVDVVAGGDLGCLSEVTCVSRP